MDFYHNYLTTIYESIFAQNVQILVEKYIVQFLLINCSCEMYKFFHRIIWSKVSVSLIKIYFRLYRKKFIQVRALESSVPLTPTHYSICLYRNQYGFSCMVPKETVTSNTQQALNPDNSLLSHILTPAWSMVEYMCIL